MNRFLLFICVWWGYFYGMLLMGAVADLFQGKGFTFGLAWHGIALAIPAFAKLVAWATRSKDEDPLLYAGGGIALAFATALLMLVLAGLVMGLLWLLGGFSGGTGCEYAEDCL